MSLPDHSGHTGEGKISAPDRETGEESISRIYNESVKISNNYRNG